MRKWRKWKWSGGNSFIEINKSKKNLASLSTYDCDSCFESRKLRFFWAYFPGQRFWKTAQISFTYQSCSDGSNQPEHLPEVQSGPGVHGRKLLLGDQPKAGRLLHVWIRTFSSDRQVGFFFCCPKIIILSVAGNMGFCGPPTLKSRLMISMHVGCFQKGLKKTDELHVTSVSLVSPYFHNPFSSYCYSVWWTGWRLASFC